MRARAVSLVAFAALAAPALFGAVGCNQLADIRQPIDRNASTTPGPGGSTTPSGKDTSPFVGEWWGQGGVLYIDCGPGLTHTEEIPSEPLTITRGTSSDLVGASSGCSLALNIVSEKLATILPNQTCTDDEGYTTVYGDGSFDLNDDKRSGLLRLTGPASFSGYSCQFAQEIPVTKR